MRHDFGRGGQGAVGARGEAAKCVSELPDWRGRTLLLTLQVPGPSSVYCAESAHSTCPVDRGRGGDLGRDQLLPREHEGPAATQRGAPCGSVQPSDVAERPPGMQGWRPVPQEKNLLSENGRVRQSSRDDTRISFVVQCSIFYFSLLSCPPAPAKRKPPPPAPTWPPRWPPAGPPSSCILSSLWQMQ